MPLAVYRVVMYLFIDYKIAVLVSARTCSGIPVC